MSQTYLPQPFGLSLSKPGRSLRAALRQAQGERACLRYVANQDKVRVKRQGARAAKATPWGTTTVRRWGSVGSVGGDRSKFLNDLQILQCSHWSRWRCSGMEPAVQRAACECKEWR